MSLGDTFWRIRKITILVGLQASKEDGIESVASVRDKWSHAD
eukprot:CAMPEP_0184648792 /NCGR_PEP_ID=MMETSP0308-20130426/6011_1 /TAXON_ID=38269 /ORGANISM="Gloeochaete witrockiana, Strain SAG 46.84" /LENGTH=41 /DNA_ID= /DNA_START= /DNA_END= /DNA_ORIENTATION=